MDCEICGKPASVHFTEAFTSGAPKKQHSYCTQHAVAAGLPVADLLQEDEARENLIRFVQTNKRAPSTDEMQKLGLLNTNDAKFAKALEFWTRFAEFLLAQQQRESPG